MINLVKNKNECFFLNKFNKKNEWFYILYTYRVLHKPKPPSLPSPKCVAIFENWETHFQWILGGTSFSGKILTPNELCGLLVSYKISNGKVSLVIYRCKCPFKIRKLLDISSLIQLVLQYLLDIRKIQLLEDAPYPLYFEIVWEFWKNKTCVASI